LKIGSLFSGVGGLELGLERAGLGRVVWQVEIDSFCRAVLENHYPYAKRFQDVCNVGKHNLEHVDVICGGFPCQDVSVAGKGEGLAGERSGLWREFARVVSELRPGWVVVENVSQGAKRWVDPVVSDLEQLGYACLLVPIEACAVGAPHERARLFIVAANAVEDDLRHLEQRASERRNARGLRDGGEAVALHDGAARDSSGPGRAQPADADAWRHPAPEFCRVDDGVSTELDKARNGALGNAVVPQCAEVIGWIIRELEEARPRS
jgi:DNA (cytosine-5)-methyltransferase 1